MRKKGTCKKLIAVALSAAMLGTSLYLRPQTGEAASDPKETHQKESYGAWKEQKPVNGDFEAGVVGMDVYGWSMVSTESDRKTEENDWRNHFHLKTVEEANGNKAAELAKTGTGYMSMASQEIDVTGATEYCLSVDYFIKEISIDTDPTTQQPYTTNNTILAPSFYVAESDGEGAFEKKEGSSNRVEDIDYEKESTEWETFHFQFKTADNTKKVRIYCWIGGGMYVNETLWVDNVKLYEPQNGEVINGDFESGRNDAGIRGWSKFAMDINAQQSNTDYSKNFAFQTEDDNNNRVAVIRKTAKNGGGYIGLKSTPIAVEGGKPYRLSVDYKIQDYVQTNLSNANKFLGVRFVIQELREDGVQLENGWNATGEKINEGINADKTSSEWATHTKEVTLKPETKSVVIYLWVGTEWNVTISALFDNVTFEPVGGNEMVGGWTKETCASFGALRSDNSDFTGWYRLAKVNGGLGYENALRLSAGAKGTQGGVVSYCDPIPVSESLGYKIGFDMKIEGYSAEEDSGDVIYGTKVVLRYKNAQEQNINEKGQVISSSVKPQQITTTKANQDWKHYEVSFNPPEGAVSVQVGLVIGTNSMGKGNNLVYTFANIKVAKADDTAAWNDYAKWKDTDLLFVLLDPANEADIKKLVQIKKGAAGDYNESLDLNRSNRINEDDAALMRWKLVGITKESELR